MKELWDARLADGTLTGGTLIRGEEIPAGLYHLVCETIIRHTDGNYLLMQRDIRKEAYPGYWEIGAGGSALRGEDPLTCIRREVREETGIGSGEFTLIGTAMHESSIFHSFLCVTDWDKDAVTLQEGETTAYRWISEGEMLAFIRSDKAIPSQMKRFAPYLDTRR